jgi:uncharacterized surface protein with fasciclin (FAS1) repeats
MEKDKSKSVIITIVAVLVLIFGGLGLYALTQNDSSSDTASESSEQNNNEQENEMQNEDSKNIVELAVATPDLSTLVAAVQAAGLVETLSGTGPFTVLAPTNDAFANLPEGTLDSLLLPENKDQLTGILTYHVIAADVMSSDLTNGQVVTTVNGGTLTVNIADDGVYFVDSNGGRAKVVTADVDASNGTVHIIDAVLLP